MSGSTKRPQLTGKRLLFYIIFGTCQGHISAQICQTKTANKANIAKSYFFGKKIQHRIMREYIKTCIFLNDSLLLRTIIHWKNGSFALEIGYRKSLCVGNRRTWERGWQRLKDGSGLWLALNWRQPLFARLAFLKMERDEGLLLVAKKYFHIHLTLGTF